MFLWAFPFRSGYSGVPPSPFFHVAGSFLTCNVTERLGQRCSLTIPNAVKRLPAPLPGHLPSAWDLQTERNTCTLYHGCTPFLCGIGFAGMACAADWLLAPRPTIIGINASWCLLIFLAVVTCIVQSFLFSSVLRLFSHCKGKTRLLRTAPLLSAMQGQAVPVW